MERRCVKVSSGNGRSRRVADKWAKSEVLRGDPVLVRHLPQTKLLTEKSLSEMLQKWGMVYAKPIRGSQGNGVMRVELKSRKRSNGGDGVSGKKYVYQLGEKRHVFSSYETFYRSFRRTIKGKGYLVQKGIRLLKHEGRPFDIRLVMQQSPQGIWEATGTLGRVAHPRKIVTNGSQGGTIYPTAYLLKAYTGKEVRRRIMEGMDQLAVRTALRLHTAYPGIKELGLDLAMDQRLKPWILEVNTLPDPCPFSLLEDQSMLRKIVRYAKAYGKTYRLHCKKAKRGKR
ncbi:YheC/YheD family protein [Paenibacillus sinopodophylli]|uniref:YheC/YheD family protein n=1 Tax=Paenibacillus sinopodophylli TaxID=1837342 RepID=UPI001FEBFD11|nr:YheC/YheD family protein [Paenibacillus sinopodophylli]